MANRLVRSLVYKRGVGIRETVWVGVWFGKTNSVGVDIFLHAEPRRRSESCCMGFWMAALVAAMGRLGPCV
jgi:hypothetical protein